MKTPARNSASSETILVTGANGFIGVKVVETLLEYGFNNVRCFVRPSGKVERLNQALNRHPAGKTAQVITGDLLSNDDCGRAVRGASIVLHLAAGIDKSFAGAFMNSALATRNLIEAFLTQGNPKRFVNVSSFAVYSGLRLKRNAVLDENCPLEDSPQERGDAYGFGKLKQEELVKEYGRTRGLPFVILRPGVVFGPGRTNLSGRIGIDTFGFFIHMGGSKNLPLTFVDNCAEAIVLAGIKPGIESEVFNVVDNDTVSSGQFLREYKKVKPIFSVAAPYFAVNWLCSLWAKYSEWSKGQLPPVFNPRRCAAEWKSQQFSNQKLCDRLGWKPQVPMNDAMASFLAQFRQPSVKT